MALRSLEPAFEAAPPRLKMRGLDGIILLSGSLASRAQRGRQRLEQPQFTRTTSFIFGWMPHSTWNVPRSVKVIGVRLPGS